MCTVTYYPYKNNFILTSNRDEHYKRKPALAPDSYIINGKELLFPKDQEAGGTWIAVQNNRVSTILNGAFERHKYEPPYKRSRGLVLLDSFDFENLEVFSKEYDFQGIEPFTFISVQKETTISIHEIRWNGEKAFYKILDAEIPHLWRSAMLYLSEDERLKQKKFAAFIENNKIDAKTLLAFNLMNGSADNDEDIILKQNSFGVETTATTQIIFNDDTVLMKYKNHLTGEITSSTLYRKAN